MFLALGVLRPAPSRHGRPAHAGRGRRHWRSPPGSWSSAPWPSPTCPPSPPRSARTSSGPRPGPPPFVEVVFAVTVIGSSAAVLAATARVWRGETADQLSPAEAEAETPAGWGSLLLLAAGPACSWPPHSVSGWFPTSPITPSATAASFTDRSGYDAAVLDGTDHGDVAPNVPAGTLAAQARGPRRDRRSNRRRRVSCSCTTDCARLSLTATASLRRLHSGHVGDQVTWAVFGLAVLAGTERRGLR